VGQPTSEQSRPDGPQRPAIHGIPAGQTKPIHPQLFGSSLKLKSVHCPAWHRPSPPSARAQGEPIDALAQLRNAQTSSTHTQNGFVDPVEPPVVDCPAVPAVVVPVVEDAPVDPPVVALPPPVRLVSSGAVLAWHATSRTSAKHQAQRIKASIGWLPHHAIGSLN
jgi:hypothetical protein